MIPGFLDPPTVKMSWSECFTLRGVGQRLLPLPLARVPMGSRGVVDALLPVRENGSRMSCVRIVTVGRLFARPSNCRQPVPLRVLGLDGAPMCHRLVLVLSTRTAEASPRDLPPSGAF